jgi:predicted RNA binding protein YcfA (HicA-like mRNA interferase family)
MKIYEIINEDFDIDEGKLASTYTIRDAKKILSMMGFGPTGRQKGSHDVWKDENGVLFTIPLNGKELDFGVTKNLNRMMRDRGITLEEDGIDEAIGLPGDSSTLLSLLSEMSNMLGAGGPQHSEGPLRSAVMQVFNNGSADDADAFGKQLNFRLGSVKSMWMGKNWPQLKSCFLRLKKNPKYQRSISLLDNLGDWPVKLIKDPKDPTLSKYFSAILAYTPPIMNDMSRFDPEEHVRDRAKRMAQLIPERVSAFNRFVSHWTNEYEKDSNPVVQTKAPKDNLAGQQSAGAQSIVDQVLNAIPRDLAKELRPQLARMGSQNEKMMFLMKSLQQAGIDPNKVLG